MLIIDSSRHSPQLICALRLHRANLSTIHIILDVLLEHVHLLSIQGPAMGFNLVLGLVRELDSRIRRNRCCTIGKARKALPGRNSLGLLWPNF